MPENPLLPNAQLRRLYKLLALAEKNLPRKPLARTEAVLAGTLLQCEDGDFILPPQDAPTPALLKALHIAMDIAQPTRDRIMLATGAALALKEADTQRLALTFVHTGPASRVEPNWAEALRYAHHADLPLVVVCIDTGGRARPTDLTWPTLTKLATSIKLAVISIDGADAVAVYRAMQESIHRARNGHGCAILWCSMPAPTTRSTPRSTTPRSTTPRARLAAYLLARGLARLTR